MDVLRVTVEQNFPMLWSVSSCPGASRCQRGSGSKSGGACSRVWKLGHSGCLRWLPALSACCCGARLTSRVTGHSRRAPVSTAQQGGEGRRGGDRRRCRDAGGEVWAIYFPERPTAEADQGEGNEEPPAATASSSCWNLPPGHDRHEKHMPEL